MPKAISEEDLFNYCHFLTPMVKSSNVKTVKEQTFHKRSTNVLKSNRNEQKCLSCSQICPIESNHFYWSRRADSGPKTKQSVLNKTNSGMIPKSFGFVSKTISEHLSFRF